MNTVETQQTGFSLHSRKRTPKRLRSPATERGRKSASSIHPPYSPHFPDSSFLLYSSCIKCTPLRKKTFSPKCKWLGKTQITVYSFRLKDEWHWNMYIITCETDRQSRFNAWDRALRAGDLDDPERLDGEGGGRGFRMGNTCTPIAGSCQYMAKTTTIL